MEGLQREVVLGERTVQFQPDESWLTGIGPVDDPQLVLFGLQSALIRGKPGQETPPKGSILRIFHHDEWIVLIPRALWIVGVGLLGVDEDPYPAVDLGDLLLAGPILPSGCSAGERNGWALEGLDDRAELPGRFPGKGLPRRLACDSGCLVLAMGVILGKVYKTYAFGVA